MIRKLILAIALLTGFAAAQNCTAPAGGWTQANQPPVGCPIYPNSIFIKLLPSAGSGGPITHLAPNSDAIAQATMQPGHQAGVASPGSADTQGNAFYYGKAPDPNYTLTSCTNQSSSPFNPVGQVWNIPNAAAYSGGQSDQFFTVWDQEHLRVMSTYASHNTYPTALNSCSGSCNINFPVSYCSMAPTSSTAYQIGNGAGDSLGEAPGALIIRENEWISGVIPHALYLNGGCEDPTLPTVVFPAKGGAQKCPTGTANAPKHGALYFLDYTDAQITAMNLPAWQKPIIVAMAHYGGYFGDTGSTSLTSDTHPNRYESGQGYLQAGLTPPLFNFLNAQGISHHTDGGSTVYTMDYWSNIPNLTGPNCLVTACGFSKHVHIADPCVALGLAGLSGGCGSSPPPPPVVNFSPTPLNFGVVPVSTSTTLTTTLSNPGGSSLTFTAAITGTGAARFAIQSTTCVSPLASLGQCIYVIRFSPTAATTVIAALTLTDNASGSPHNLPLQGTGGTATIAFSPTSLSYATTAVGSQTASQSTTITNTGTAPAILNTQSIGGANPGDWIPGTTNTCTTGISLAPGKSCILSAIFKPTATGARAATIAVTSNASGPQSIPLTGSGGTFTSTLTPTSFNFGSQQVGTATAPHAFTYTNTGTLANSITNITNSSAAFTESDNCPRAPATLAPAGTCTVNGVFNPPVAGALSGTLAVISNAPTASSALSGTGTAPQLTLSPASFNFQNVLTGTDSALQNFTLANSGSGTASISSIVTAAPFFLTTTCGSTLAPAANCTITAHAHPTALGLVTGQITVTDSAAGSPHKAALSVTGVTPTFTLTPASFNFLSQAVGSATATQNFTLTNTGTGPGTISVALTGAFPGDYLLVTTTCGSNVPAGQSCLIGVQFKPTAPGVRGANLSVTNSSAVSPISSTLSGTGVATASSICLSVTNVNFFNQPVNSTSNPVPITATNCGTAALTSVVITPTGNFTQTNNFSVSVAVGASFTIQAKFAPLSAGPLTGNFSIASNSPNTPDVITLSGFGTQFGVTLNPTTLPFGTVIEGQTPVLTSVLTNTGNTARTVNAPTITGSSDYSVTVDCTTIAPAGTCLERVVFSPSSVGSITGTLHQTFGDGLTTVTASLTGTGQAPTPAVTVIPNPAPFDFGNAVVGVAAPIQVFQIVNSGLGTLNISGAPTFTGTNAGDYALSNNTCTIPIPPLQNCVVTVTAIPGGIGDRTANLHIVDDAADSPQDVTLIVHGVAAPAPKVVLSATSLAFSPPSITVGQTSAAQTLSVTNNGDSNLIMSGTSLSGANQTDFQLSNNTCSTIIPQATCSVDVNCKPTGPGSLSASLDFANNASDTPQHVALTCTAISGTPIITVPITAVDFHNCTVGTTCGPVVFIITNTGNATATGLSLSAAGATGDWTLVTACGSSLTANTSCSSSITFSPQQLCGQFQPNTSTCVSNDHLGTITILSQTSNSPQQISLQGTAIPIPPPPGPIQVIFGGHMVLGGHLRVSR